jgi:hypothetical protein
VARLDGYLKTDAYDRLERDLSRFIYVLWNVGLGPMASFTQAISSVVQDRRKIRLHGPYDKVRGGEFFKSLYVQVTSRMARRRKMQDEQDTVLNKMIQVLVSAYSDVNHRYLTEGISMVSMDDVPPVRETERHVEISAAQRYPRGLKGAYPMYKCL